MEVPADRPKITPEVVIGAIEVVALLHAPPEGLQVRLEDTPTHMFLDPPAIAFGVL
jgi:dihydroorotase-like cyclic amidohydrolase